MTYVKIEGTEVPEAVKGKTYEVNFDSDNDIRISDQHELVVDWGYSHPGYVWGPHATEASRDARGYTVVPAPEPTPEVPDEVPTEASTEVKVSKVILSVTPGDVEGLHEIFEILSSYDLIDRVTLG